MAFAISELECRNGWLGIAPIPGRGGTYEADLSELLRWSPDLVLTMTTEGELRRVGAEGLESDLTAVGIDWRHLPIEDFGAPGPSVEADWSGVSTGAHEVLERGGRVLAHCFGGHGRSGMVLMRLMVEAGELPDYALERLRDVRPGAVETEAQRAWAARPFFK